MLKVEQYQFMDWVSCGESNIEFVRWYIETSKEMVKDNWDGYIHLYSARLLDPCNASDTKWGILFRGQLGFLGDIFGETFDGTESEVKDAIEKFLVRMDKLIAFM